MPEQTSSIEKSTFSIDLSGLRTGGGAAPQTETLFPTPAGTTPSAFERPAPRPSGLN
jgi:hypothetical protein